MCIVSILDVAVHLIGIGWFGSSLSSCAVGVDLIIASGVMVGTVSLFLPRVGWINVCVGLVMLVSLAAFIVLIAQSEFPCGAPIRIEAPWISAGLIAIYLVRVILIGWPRGALEN